MLGPALRAGGHGRMTAAPRVKVGVNLALAKAGAVVALAQRAEACGYESVWLSDHAALRADGADIVARYGRLLYRPDADFVSPLVALAAIAQATSTIRIGVSVLIAPLRNPLLLARDIATLDILSSGRLELGLGVGWNADEFRAVGADYSTRGARMDEMLDVMRTLFTDERPEFHGRYYGFDPIGFEPKPIQQPGPKLLIGGTSEAALRRAVRRGDGWLASGPIDRIMIDAQRARQAWSDAGRTDPFDVMVTMLDHLPDADELDGIAAGGIDRLLISPWQDTGEPRLGTVGVDEADALDHYATSIGLRRHQEVTGR